MDYRKLNTKEAILLDFLIKSASINIPLNWQETLRVKEMDDNEMGSLALFPSNIDNNRAFGKKASECSFKDKDGIVVIASLYLDDNGKLFELDIWKTDFSPVIQIPDKFDHIT